MLNQLREVFASLEKHEAKYLIIGGIAVVLHGVPRTTFDLDILIESSVDNAQKLLNAFLDINLGTAALISAEKLIKKEITIFQDRIRIDVQTKTPGLMFENAWQNKVTMNYRGQSFYVVSKADLISSKRAAGREIDLQDVRLLELDKNG